MQNPNILVHLYTFKLNNNIVGFLIVYIVMCTSPLRYLGVLVFLETLPLWS